MLAFILQAPASRFWLPPNSIRLHGRILQVPVTPKASCPVAGEVLGYALAQPGDLLGHRAEPFILLFLLLFLALPGFLTTLRCPRVGRQLGREGGGVPVSFLAG